MIKIRTTTKPFAPFSFAKGGTKGGGAVSVQVPGKDA
jgi:hypothetical protein